MGGRFEDGFKVAFLTAAAAYAYSSYSSGYNENNGKAHFFQNGGSDVGKQGLLSSNPASDQHWGMKLIGKLPTFDSMAEFHDGWLENGNWNWLDNQGLNQLSIVPAMGINALATYSERYNAFETANFIRDN